MDNSNACVLYNQIQFITLTGNKPPSFFIVYNSLINQQLKPRHNVIQAVTQVTTQHYIPRGTRSVTIWQSFPNMVALTLDFPMENPWLILYTITL